jgi:uncharacterized membrane protein YtjA (UPF0391 family)
MHRRAAQHEIGAGDANLRAVLQQANMLQRGVGAAFLETVHARRKANRMTIETIGNAVLHRGHGVLLLTGENEASAGQVPVDEGRRFGTSSGVSCLDGACFLVRQDWRFDMLYWALVFLVVALIAGALGFGGIAGASAGIAKILFFIFLVLLVISLVTHVMRGSAP